MRVLLFVSTVLPFDLTVFYSIALLFHGLLDLSLNLGVLKLAELFKGSIQGFLL
jgi:hypothetical protein